MAELRGREDTRLHATVRSRRPLLYADGPDAAIDRPAHVRAGSGLAVVGRRLAVVQDDANFLALVEPTTGLAHAIALPDVDGVRLFDKTRGNKRLKLDLEACVAGNGPDGPWLIAFGSGSKARRDRIVRVTDLDGAGRVEVIDGQALYRRLGDWKEFSGSELNLEGAVLADGVLRLFQRGNGRADRDHPPIDATCDLDWGVFLAWIDGRGPVPEPTNGIRCDLGELAGIRLTFGDAAVSPHGLLFLASAEASPDAIEDGPVSGLVLGTLDEARWTRVREADGTPVADKAEGLAIDPADPQRAWLIVDADDPGRPSELLEVELAGPWRGN